MPVPAGGCSALDLQKRIPGSSGVVISLDFDWQNRLGSRSSTSRPFEGWGYLALDIVNGVRERGDALYYPACRTLAAPMKCDELVRAEFFDVLPFDDVWLFSRAFASASESGDR